MKLEQGSAAPDAGPLFLPGTSIDMHVADFVSITLSVLRMLRFSPHRS
jgi:hypothetical protein